MDRTEGYVWITSSLVLAWVLLLVLVLALVLVLVAVPVLVLVSWPPFINACEPAKRKEVYPKKIPVGREGCLSRLLGGMLAVGMPS